MPLNVKVLTDNGQCLCVGIAVIVVISCLCNDLHFLNGIRKWFDRSHYQRKWDARWGLCHLYVNLPNEDVEIPGHISDVKLTCNTCFPDSLTRDIFYASPRVLIQNCFNLHGNKPWVRRIKLGSVTKWHRLQARFWFSS